MPEIRADIHPDAREKLRQIQAAIEGALGVGTNVDHAVERIILDAQSPEWYREHYLQLRAAEAKRN